MSVKRRQKLGRQRKSNEPSSEKTDLKIDTEGVIKPGTDVPQETGDENVEITKLMMSQVNVGKRNSH